MFGLDPQIWKQKIIDPVQSNNNIQTTKRVNTQPVTKRGKRSGPTQKKKNAEENIPRKGNKIIKRSNNFFALLSQIITPKNLLLVAGLIGFMTLVVWMVLIAPRS